MLKKRRLSMKKYPIILIVISGLCFLSSPVLAGSRGSCGIVRGVVEQWGTPPPRHVVPVPKRDVKICRGPAYAPKHRDCPYRLYPSQWRCSTCHARSFFKYIPPTVYIIRQEPAAFRRVWNPGHYDRYHRWVPGEWILIQR